MAADRTDVQYAAKECCRGMAAPEQRHLGSVENELGRFLAGRPEGCGDTDGKSPLESVPSLTVISRAATGLLAPLAGAW